MLVFTLNPGTENDTFYVGEAKIVVSYCNRHKIKVMIDAPKDIPVDRKVIRDSKKQPLA